MKIIVVSDTHKKNDNYFKVLQMHKPDMVIHCGDAEGSEYALTEAADCPVQIVLGNNDFFSDLPREIEVNVGPYKVWVTHGHNYYVSMGNENIKREAIARGADIVMYGHTHYPEIVEDGNMTIINPGSLTFPRQPGHKSSYIVAETDENGEVTYELKFL